MRVKEKWGYSATQVRRRCAGAFLRRGWAMGYAQRRTASGRRLLFAAPPPSAGAPPWGTAAPSGSGAPAPATATVDAPGVRICHSSNAGPLPAPALGPSYLRSHARVPADIVAAPQLEVSGRYHRVQDVVLVVHIKGVSEVFGLAVRRAPRSFEKPLTLITHRVPSRFHSNQRRVCTLATARPGLLAPPARPRHTNHNKQQAGTMHCKSDRKSREKTK